VKYGKEFNKNNRKFNQRKQRNYQNCKNTKAFTVPPPHLQIEQSPSACSFYLFAKSTIVKE